LTDKRSAGSLKPLTIRSTGSPLYVAEPDSQVYGTTTSTLPDNPKTSSARA